MDLIQLLSFHEIVKTESFSKASKNIFRSQSAVSHQIRNLEEELEVKLFERLGKGIKVTEEGRILFDIIDQFFYDLDDLRKIYRDIKDSKVGNLTIASSSAMMTYVLPNIIKQFTGRFKGINFKLIACSSNSEILSLILEGITDFGIGIKSSKILPKKINFLSWRTFDTLVMMKKDHPLSHQKPVTLGDIASYPLIVYRKGSIIRNIIEEVYARKEIDYKIIMEVDVPENIKGYVEMGLGVGILSSVAITSKDQKKFAISNVNHLFGKVEIGIYYRKDQYISMAMREFIQLFAPKLCDRLFSHSKS